jgi:hypothetical protein
MWTHARSGRAPPDAVTAAAPMPTPRAPVPATAVAADPGRAPPGAVTLPRRRRPRCCRLRPRAARAVAAAALVPTLAARRLGPLPPRAGAAGPPSENFVAVFAGLGNHLFIHFLLQ